MEISCNKQISLQTTAQVLVLPETIIGTNGLRKTILQKGVSWQTPIPGDEVEVHYNVRLQEGDYFDSSREKGTPFSFKLGQFKYEAKCENGMVISESKEGLEFSLASGHLCPAMSIAVKTMRKGEKAELSVKFSYGLMHCGDGTSTIDDTIPTFQNLIIYLELVSWSTVVDIRGDKKILKKITKKGEAFVRPNEGSLVKVVYIKKLEDGTTLEKQGSDEEHFEYVCGEEQINEGLDTAVMTMRKGEEAIVKISSDLLDPSKAGGLAVLYEIKLIDFIKEKPFWKMDAHERITACETKKNEGNTLFKAGKFQLASKKYEKECDLRKAKQYCRIASKYVEYNHSFSDDEKHQANSLRLSCYLNDAACKLKLGAYQEVSKLCTKVLELDPYNVKALFRRSQAYMTTSDLEKAEEDITRALSIDPNNKYATSRRHVMDADLAMQATSRQQLENLMRSQPDADLAMQVIVGASKPTIAYLSFRPLLADSWSVA
ncbi:hypothetical protein DH2020_039066 [Rehmannia glutinosa]|uniref:peptidylprolyl isomerase n=1 Tax=Rehmannia glutinosa TaxID=99300 RepID=A0ABR0UYF6_REHGL